ncbi:hypothetical protein M231_01218 [Tremella mesenterica]|uniref:Uncharacterized protein n=1 Tax=Tremella mesenterica TaxID=5217 RepID=A0A4Q1BU21_TREME|nr:hypothetical protein M231_01218 [Tremella mesenterica]
MHFSTILLPLLVLLVDANEHVQPVQRVVVHNRQAAGSAVDQSAIVASIYAAATASGSGLVTASTFSATMVPMSEANVGTDAGADLTANTGSSTTSSTAPILGISAPADNGLGSTSSVSATGSASGSSSSASSLGLSSGSMWSMAIGTVGIIVGAGRVLF